MKDESTKPGPAPPAPTGPARPRTEDTAPACRDGGDDDGDGFVDCADQDCQSFVFCVPPASQSGAAPSASPAGPTATVGRATGEAPPPGKKGFSAVHLMGPAFLVIGYVGTLGMGALASEGRSRSDDIMAYSAIPVAGPWILLGEDMVEDYTVEYAVMGVMQGMGLAFCFVSLAVLASGSSERRQASAFTTKTAVGTLGVSPVLGPTTAGINVSLGAF